MEDSENGYVNKGYTTQNNNKSVPISYNSGFNNQHSSVYTISDNIPLQDQKTQSIPVNDSLVSNSNEILTSTEDKHKRVESRDKWGSDIEFLFSCIALSVGLGNVWRFPFTALDNGGGAFLIPYLIVLILVGKPVYYMEMVLGQFSSRGSIKVFDFSPIMRGVGYGQVMGTTIVVTYYASLMALTVRYFVASFASVLPWSYCREEWNTECINSSLKIANLDLENNISAVSSMHTKDLFGHKRTSAELYFLKEILKEKTTIHDGIGVPNWELVICLAVSWAVVALILIRGIRSSGKASYFLAIFPYVVMLVLLVRALTLPGAFNGVLYFINPQWDQLTNPKVWYAAVTQVFFSLAICFGNIVMYASYNRFSQNIYRDATIVTTLDTFTSLLAGIIIFGVLGNLAYETGTNDIKSVVKGGSSLAFVSYPDAIAKFAFIPQVFSVLFFVMLFVLGIGSNVGMASCIMTVIRDRFSNWSHWMVALGISIGGFAIGNIYLTPGGQYMLNLLDFYGASFVAFVLAIAELIAVGWIYGVKRLCKDIEFMLDKKTGIYWRICWSLITPGLMIAILLYTIIDMSPLKYGDYIYPDSLYTFGWCLSAFGILQLPLWGIYAMTKQKNISIWRKFLSAFNPQENWGPIDPVLREKYKQFIINSNSSERKSRGIFHKIYDNIFG
ncbi:sodium-dependent nutrient amino acid transporter 1 [Condylostylus longicornis]|uniref:sodium-dependent nutrient amino acid transporter 1 n=1 Tax=Condylostylus longicornis TaxID=2530218 RepID=UPI00244DA14E|nr:sodium-dependent nutrient amino acid transporter 1 [Condylostylus longicornis]XP_055372892.1 sodium-dependent nutrient amino acid transporter 1 [Condylostylus longicornis]